MTATFTLLVLDQNHIILATERRMRPEEQRQVAEAFARWKAEGGVAIIGDCLVKDREAVEIELRLPDLVVETVMDVGEPTDEAVDEFVRSHGGK